MRKITSIIGIILFGFCFLITNPASAEVTTYTDASEWEAVAGAYDEETFDGVAGFDTFVGKFDGAASTSYSPPAGQISLQEMGSINTVDERASFEAGGGNYIDVYADPNRPDNPNGAAPAARLVFAESDYARITLANNYTNSTFNMGDDDVRFRILLDKPVKYFGFFYNASADFELELAPNGDPTVSNGATTTGDTTLINDAPLAVSGGTGFYGVYSDVAFSSVIFQNAGYDPAGSRKAAILGIDDVRWTVPLSIEDIINFFRDSVASGELKGKGRLRVVRKLNLAKMRQTLLSAKGFLDENLTTEACFVLERAFLRSDGDDLLLRDYVRDGEDSEIPGEPSGATDGLAIMLLEIMDDLGCVQVVCGVANE